jgi:N-methylhydantoinase A/oxoprolinase/acetone carboxylase beta subunit
MAVPSVDIATGGGGSRVEVNGGGVLRVGPASASREASVAGTRRGRRVEPDGHLAGYEARRAPRLVESPHNDAEGRRKPC